MGKMTPSQARNGIRRALNQVLDQPPSVSKKQQIWEFFDSSCAYCGRTLLQSERKGHLDHLISTTRGGTNALGNLVLACSTCNGDEKREQQWDLFLARKATGENYNLRKERIEKWMSTCSNFCSSPQTVNAVNEAVEEAIKAFDKALEKIRTLKNS